MLVAVDLSRLSDSVRWEPARGGELFPHIYGRLPMEAVVTVGSVERTADGAVNIAGLEPHGLDFATGKEMDAART